VPSQLALLLCAGLVLALLRIERQQAPEQSNALWVPTIWMMNCAAKPLASWFSPGDTEGVDVEAGSPMDRMFLIVLLVASITILSRRKLNWTVIKGNTFWLIVLCGYALVSILWSDFVFVSIKRYIRFCGTPLVAMIILSEASPKVAMESVLRRTAFVLVPFSLLLIKYFPNLGVMYGRWSGELMWVGVTSQKNALGILCFVSAFFLFWRMLRAWSERKPGEKWSRKQKLYVAAEVAVLAIAIYLLKGPGKAYSATSLVVSFVGVSGLLALTRMRKRQKYLPPVALYTVVALCFIYGMGIPFGAASVSSGFMEALGRDATFTDRDQIWRELVPIAMQNSILGQGYGGFWVLPIESGVNEAHNGYLDLMLELGLVGIVLLFAFVISLCKAAYRGLSQNFWWCSLTICLSVMTLVHNSTESSFLKTSNFLWSLLVILYLLVNVPVGFLSVVKRVPSESLGHS